VIIDIAASRLNNVDIFSSNRVLDLQAALSDRKFLENAIARWHTKNVGDGVNQLRVGIAPKNDYVADHCEGRDLGIRWFWLEIEVGYRRGSAGFQKVGSRGKIDAMDVVLEG
tara:strand:- start:179 stop:514 length:336 start_codon:yes stop_codon:yes gene_type:complete